MGYQLPDNNPLSLKQKQLTSQLEGMQNFLTENDAKNVAKRLLGINNLEAEISVYDYLVKILEAMGLDPDFIINSFIKKFFNTDYLVGNILKGMSQVLAFFKTSLDPDSPIENSLSENLSAYLGGSTPIEDLELSKSEKTDLSKVNLNYLEGNSLIVSSLSLAVDALKMRLMKELMAMIFGAPKDVSAAQELYPDTQRLNVLEESAGCGSAVFSVTSSPPLTRNEDLEYNRYILGKKLKKDPTAIKVSCDGVEVELPDNPSFLYGESAAGSINTRPLSAEQSADVIVEFIGSQVSKKNKQKNASTAAKKFRKQMLETLLSNIMEVLKPILFGTFVTNAPDMNLGAAAAAAGVQTGSVMWDGLIEVLRETPNGSSLPPTQSFIPPSPCELLQQLPNNASESEKKEKTKLEKIVEIFCNIFLNAAISFIMVYVIKYLKKFAARYISKMEFTRIRERINSVKGKLKNEKAALILKKTKKAAKIAALGVSIANVIKTGEITFF